MQKAPYYIAIGFIAITIVRVSVFVALGLHVGPLGYVFGVVVGMWVYVSTFWLNRKETFWPALVSTIISISTDLFFNELELVRSLSTQAMVAPESNFMGIGAENLRYLMQFAALVFGAIPTVAAASLGWLQSSILKIKEFNKPSGWERVMAALFRIVSGLGMVVAVRVEAFAAFAGQQVPQNSPGSGAITRWEDLTASDKTELAGKIAEAGNDKKALGALTLWLMGKYGGGDRRARMWVQWIREGK